MASLLESDTAAKRLQESTSARLDAIPSNLLTPLQDEELDCSAAEPSRMANAVETLRDELATSPDLQGSFVVSGPEAPSARRRGPWLERVPTLAIRPLATMLRQRLELTDLKALAASIKSNGLAQPLLVRINPTRPGIFELFVGYRRWRAALVAKIASVPVIVFDSLSEAVALELGLLENLHRRDLTIIEEAETFRVLVDRYGRTHDQIAALTGRSRNQVTNMLCLAALPEEVRLRLRMGQIGFGHGRALLGTEDPAALARRIVTERLTVRETELLAAQLRVTARASESTPTLSEGRPGISISTPTGLSSTTGPAENPSQYDLRTLQAALSVEIGAQFEVRTNPGDSTLLIQGKSTEHIVSVVALLRDALRLLRMNRLISEASRDIRAG